MSERQALEMLPGFDPSAARDQLRAIGVVKPQQRRLAEDVGRAQARRMSRVALDLDRPAHLALDQHAAGESVDRHRGSEKERPARDDFLGRLHVRNDRFGRLIGTARDARQRQRRGRDLQEIAPAGPGQRFLDPRQKLVRPRSPRSGCKARQLFEAPPDNRQTRSPDGGLALRSDGALSSTVKLG